MMKQVWSVWFAGMLACSARSASEDSARVSSSSLAQHDAPQTARPDASATCAAADPESCRDIREQLRTARRALSRSQAELAQMPGQVSLRARFTLQGRPLELERPYTLPVGQLRFRALRFWMTQVTLSADDGVHFDVPESYYLMEARGEQALRGGTQAATRLPARRREVVDIERVPPRSYSTLAFNVGVDAAHNDDLSLSAGELTVLQNMASIEWMWFTSYIFTQLEAVQAGDPNSIMEDGGVPFDMTVAWETGSNPDLRRVELRLPSPVQIGFGAPTQIDVELDVAMLFDGLGQQLVAARTASPSAPVSSISAADSAARTQLSDNWSRAFKVVRVGYGAR